MFTPEGRQWPPWTKSISGFAIHFHWQWRFSKDRIYQIIRGNAAKTAKDILDAILDSLKQFQEDVKLEDDMTLVVIKVAG